MSHRRESQREAEEGVTAGRLARGIAGGLMRDVDGMVLHGATVAVLRA